MARPAVKRKVLERPAEELIPPEFDYESLKSVAKACMACPLYKLGTQTVFGEGSLQAKIIFVGEQPGDQEDLSDHVFVGPAGKLLTTSMETVGLKRKDVYLTNAVKHFK